jgi:hypothetical protein
VKSNLLREGIRVIPAVGRLIFNEKLGLGDDSDDLYDCVDPI